LSSGAIEHAFAVGAKLSGCAFISTSSAVVEVNFGIDTYAGAIGEIRRAYTVTAGADLTTSAFGVASSAVIWVAVGIDTGARTNGLTAGTRDHTLAIGTDFTCFAAYAAGSAMIAVVVEIDADIAAFG
jgi:hypothetical protein